MQMRPLYSIGHGNRKPEEFLALLRKFGIEYLIDVRSQPFSRYTPLYNKPNLDHDMAAVGIRYVFMGDALGGRPKDNTCYDAEGKVDYEAVKTKDFFLSGIERLKTAQQKDCGVVIMCSESNPCECHRSKLIGRVLSEDRVPLMHIDETGKLKSQAMVINQLNKGLAEKDLFGNVANSTSIKTYR
jgi:uncharacterized protein (DUF488 family)